MKNFFDRALLIHNRINELTAENYPPYLYGSKSFIEKSRKIASWMHEAGLETRIDNIGNIRGKLKSNISDAKTFVIGSHIDTLVSSGKNNGILGILAGLDIIENIKDQQKELPFDIELIAFVEKEGIRFNYTNLGSKVVASDFENKTLRLKDPEGQTLAEVLKSLQLNPENVKQDAIPAEGFLGYFEIHEEEGSVLSEADIPLGIVNSIYGQKRIEIVFSGKSGHAGMVAMHNRFDALAAAAKFMVSVEKFARKEKRTLLATVGKIDVPNSATNKIPGKVICSLDIRSDDAQLLSDAYENIYFLCEKICGKRNIYFDWRLIQESEPVICNKKLRKFLENSISEKNIQLVNMVSGAVYDAALISKVAPVAMLLAKPIEIKYGNSVAESEKKNISLLLEVSDHFMQQIISAPDKAFRKKEK